MTPHQNSNYEMLVIPLDYNKSFLDLDGREIKNYYSWFLSIKGERVSYLCDFLFHKEKEDALNESNLNVIEIFMQNSVSVITKISSQYNSELSNIPDRLKPYAKPDNYLLDERTISICYDVAMFLGDLAIVLDQKIKWILETNDDYADYGQPVLVKKGSKLAINPFAVTKNMAAKIHEGNYQEGQLANFFSAWKKSFRVGS